MAIDMSSRAIDRRLRRVSELKNLCLALKKARRIDTDADPCVAEKKSNYSIKRGRSE